jgi:serine/threonine protein kinase
MAEERNCPKCGADLTDNAPRGLCPQCLMRAGLQAGSEDKEAGSSEINHSIPTSATQQGGFVPPEPKELAEKFPQLEIIELLGQGGMGAVYKARQKLLDRVVALKILPPGIDAEPAFAKRFTREARALARLNHPGVVTLYEYGQAEGLYFFLMEFVDGVSLRDLQEVGRIAPREALAIVPQICDALQYAHDQGIVHRDIKPENILLDRQGRVKVADFGLAKLVASGAETFVPQDTASGQVSLTEVGKIMGTPQYMAPEQRDHPTEVDHRADIYSLGVVFYQMLTGELPGKRIEPPSRKVQLDVRLDEVVLRALEKDPEQRYQHVSQVKSAVETIAGMPATQVAASATGQPQTGDSPPRLLKVGKCAITTPEKLATAAEQFFSALRYKGQLLLDDRQLTFSGAGTHTVIPLAAIRDLSIGHYPRIMNPVGLDFISVTYDADGRTKRLFFTPMVGLVGLPWHFNQFVADWFTAIRDAVTAATGHSPGNTPAAELGTPSSSPVLVAMFGVLLLPPLLGFFALTRRSAETSSGHATGILVFIAGMLAIAFLAPFVFGFFGRSRKPATPRRSRTAFVMVRRRGGRAVIHWPGVLLSFLAILVLCEAGAIMGSLVLMGRIDERIVGIAMFLAVTLTGILIHRGRTTPQK